MPYHWFTDNFCLKIFVVCLSSIPILIESFIFFGRLGALFGFFSICYILKYGSLAFVFLCFQWDIFMNSLIPKPLIDKRYFLMDMKRPSLQLLTLKFKKGFQSMAFIYLVEMDCNHPTTNLCSSRCSFARKTILASLTFHYSQLSLELGHLGWTIKEHPSRSVLWIELHESFSAWNTSFFIMFCFSVLWKIWSRCLSINSTLLITWNNNVNKREREVVGVGRQLTFKQLNHFLQPGENYHPLFNMLFGKTHFNQVYKHIHVIVTTLSSTSQQAYEMARG